MSAPVVEYGTGRPPSSRQEAMDAAYAALSAQWSAQSMPKERFGTSFKSGWGACGEAMTVLDSFGAEGMTWSHASGWHRAEFSCTFSTLKSMQAALRGVPVLDLRFFRVNSSGRAAGEGGGGG